MAAVPPPAVLLSAQAEGPLERGRAQSCACCEACDVEGRGPTHQEGFEPEHGEMKHSTAWQGGLAHSGELKDSLELIQGALSAQSAGQILEALRFGWEEETGRKEPGVPHLHTRAARGEAELSFPEQPHRGAGAHTAPGPLCKQKSSCTVMPVGEVIAALKSSASCQQLL